MEIRYSIIIRDVKVVSGQRHVEPNESWNDVLICLIDQLVRKYGTWATIKLEIVSKPPISQGSE